MDNDKKVITMTYSPPFQVKLTYFRDTGKFYSEGEYMSDKLAIYEIWDEVRIMLSSGKRPGLVDEDDPTKPSFPYVLVECPTHPHDHPHLMIYGRF